MGTTPKIKVYCNPVLAKSTPDPTVIQAPDGMFYLYATEDIHNIPIYKSPDLVNWTFVGTAFTDATRPTFEPKAGLWAPDINHIDGKYVLYYAMSRWGGEHTLRYRMRRCRLAGRTIYGPGKALQVVMKSEFKTLSIPFISKKTEKNTCFGEVSGVFVYRIKRRWTSYPSRAKPTQIAGTAYEAVYVHKKGEYYYLFASIGSCCQGEKSTYTTVVGRSESLFGPYMDKNGNPMLDNHHEVVIHPNASFAGTGHNAEIMTDKKGDDWILYHAYIRDKAKQGRVVYDSTGYTGKRVGLTWKEICRRMKPRLPNSKCILVKLLYESNHSTAMKILFFILFLLYTMSLWGQHQALGSPIPGSDYRWSCRPGTYLEPD